MLSVPPAIADIDLLGHDALGDDGDGFQPRGAHAVHSRGGHIDGQPRAEYGDSGDIHALLGFGHGASQHDIFDLFRLQVRHARERALNGERGEVIGARVAQTAPRRLANCGAYRSHHIHGLHSGIVYPLLTKTIRPYFVL
jgi:hypothetical protein